MRLRHAIVLSLLATGGARPARAAGSASLPDSAVASIAGEPVTLREVDARAAAALTQIRQQEYDARANALDAILDERALAREAAAQRLTVAALLDRELAARVPAPDPAIVDSFYTRNRGQ